MRLVADRLGTDFFALLPRDTRLASAIGSRSPSMSALTPKTTNGDAQPRRYGGHYRLRQFIDPDDHVGQLVLIAPVIFPPIIEGPVAAETALDLTLERFG